MIFPTSFFLLASVYSSAVLALKEKHHAAIAHPRHRAEASHLVERNLTERGFEYNNIRATWYGAGLGACGDTYSKGDFIVALAQNTFGFHYPSPYCNRPIEISYGGKTARAKIVDSCVACAWYNPHALDLTEGLFSYFADTSAGVINVDWSFTDEGNDDTPKPKPKHTTSTHHSTSTHHTTTSKRHTSTRTTTSTSTVHTSTSHHTTSYPTTTSTTSSSAVPTSSSLPELGNIYNVNEVILNLENILMGATA